MRSWVSGSLGAFEALMRETPGSNHYDDGCDGRYPECRNCRYHLPYSKRRDCIFDECPYMTGTAEAPVKGGDEHGCVSR